eukprot:scaffold1139_cov107-Skeletonema_dohrnii-CCMP3373.AAC.5
MGIKGLAKLLSDEAPDSLREVPLSSLQGRKIAVDASMAIYQFLIAVRSGGPGGAAMMLTNADGETTSHIQGLFNRTIRFITEGIRPAYVFDGKPPQFKSHELVKRREKRQKAEEALKAAEESGNIEEQDKQNKRLVRAGTKENNDCKKLLRLMGVPVIEAPCEAEAQAAALAEAGKVYATATEDMDALTFRTPIQIRKMTFANASKAEVQQISYAKAIEGLGITHEQFVDLCILLGCDYCDTIRGIGPKTALKLIREHKNIETILDVIDRNKYVVPETYEPMEARKRKMDEDKKKAAKEADTDDEGEDAAKEEKEEDDDEEELIPVFVEARRLFNHHEVLPNDEVELKWTECQPGPLRTFLVDDMGFNPDRVKPNPEADKKRAAKRKAEKEAEKAKKKKGKAGGKKK